MDLVEFLHARLDEDERMARAVEDSVGTHREGEMFDDNSGTASHDAFPSYPWGAEAAGLPFMAGPGHPARVLSDVQAKRAIIAMHTGRHECVAWQRHSTDLTPYPDDYGTDSVFVAEGYIHENDPTLRLLAAVHADHPDFDPEWMPQPDASCQVGNASTTSAHES